MFAGLLLVAAATLPAPQSPDRVLIIGLDGVRSDTLRLATTPNIDALVETGTVSWTAFTGGSIDATDPTHQPTHSGPGWSSALTGVWADRHGVTGNGFVGSNFANYPHFFSHIRAARPDANLASIVRWPALHLLMFAPYPGLATFAANRMNDRGVTIAAVDYLTNDDPDVLFVHLDGTDATGHAWGYGPAVPSYLQAIETNDAQVGTILEALYARPNYANENWLILMATDHGGSYLVHGDHQPAQRQIWMIANGGSVGHTVIDPGPGLTSIAATALAHLKVTPPPSLGLPLPFAIPRRVPYAPQPRDAETAVPEAFELTWAPASKAHRYVVQLSTSPLLGPTDEIGITNELRQPVADLAAGTTYYWRVLAQTDGGTVTGPVWSFTTAFELHHELMLHVDFEERADDRSQHVPTHTIAGNANYVTGPEGKALSLQTTSDYVSYDSPAALAFGANDDFSVAFWIRTDGFLDTPVLLGNKVWPSFADIGWTIAGDYGGTWQWNYRGSNGERRYHVLAGYIADGAWHLITVTHERGGMVRFYQDGKTLTAGQLFSPGSIDALATVVGQDGALSSYLGSQAEIDELRIWRRVVGEHEVVKLWAQGPDAVWRRLPGGSIGAGGVPELDCVGSHASGAAVEATIATHTDAAAGVLAFGFEVLNIPMLGGTLVPDPLALQPVVTDAAGNASLPWMIPDDVVVGSPLWLQAWMLDASTATGFAASNGLIVTTR